MHSGRHSGRWSGTALAVLVLLAGLVAPVHADEAELAVRNRFAVTTSLSSLTTPIYALKLEIPWRANLTGALRLGAGKHTTARLDAVDTVEGDVQGLWYPGGDFRRGLQLAASLGYAHNWVSADGISGNGRRLRAALLAGLKWTGPHGFVGELQGGLGVQSVAGETQTDAEVRPYADVTLDPRFDISFGLGF
jgi:hypothetical protein